MNELMKQGQKYVFHAFQGPQEKCIQWRIRLTLPVYTNVQYIGSIWGNCWC